MLDTVQEISESSDCYCTPFAFFINCEGRSLEIESIQKAFSGVFTIQQRACPCIHIPPGSDPEAKLRYLRTAVSDDILLT